MWTNFIGMETTVHKAKTHFSELLKRAEAGEDVVIRRGRGTNAQAFRIVPVHTQAQREITPKPEWAGAISYTDESIWKSEWDSDED